MDSGPAADPTCLDAGLPVDGLAEIWDVIMKKITYSDVS